MIGELPSTDDQIFVASETAYENSYRAKRDTWSALPLPPKIDIWAKRVRSLAAELGREPSVADFGSGAGYKTDQLTDNYGFQVTGIEYTREGVAIARSRNRHPSIANRVSFMQGDLRYLNDMFPDNSFTGGMDYQALASIPEKFWPQVVKGYHDVLVPRGQLIVNYIQRNTNGGSEFHGLVENQLKNRRWIIFEPDPNNPSHQTEECKRGMYIYFTDQIQAADAFVRYFQTIDATPHLHPNGKRSLLTVLYESRKR